MGSSSEVERPAVNRDVAGSSPASPATDAPRPISVKQWFRVMRAHDWDWQREGFLKAFNLADKIHRQHNPELLPVGPISITMPAIVRSTFTDEFIDAHSRDALYQGPGGNLALLIDAGLYSMAMTGGFGR